MALGGRVGDQNEVILIWPGARRSLLARHALNGEELGADANRAIDRLIVADEFLDHGLIFVRQPRHAAQAAPDAGDIPIAVLDQTKLSPSSRSS